MGARGKFAFQRLLRRGGTGIGFAVKPHEQMGVFNHARQLGGDHLQGLDVVRSEIIPLGILGHDDAHRVHLAQNRNRQEGDVALLLASRNEFVVRIVGGLRLANRTHFLQRRAGDAFPDLQPQVADQTGIQSLVRAQNQLLRLGLVEIDRADRGPHVPRHGGYRLGQESIQPGLEIKEPHQLADVAHQRDIVLLKIAHRRLNWFFRTSFQPPDLTSVRKKVLFSRFNTACPMV